ncbi:MAG: hypothetical protein IPO09_15900 [Anaeromyxobacter sp.]|nr:hypothetical protein [Anaeromyxobacter sp.]MBL0276157.1 hypothetical protein [Anaeromyxobacter sp.]
MELRTLSPPPPGRAPAVASLRRELTALFRWRTRWLPTVAPARAVRAARLLPVLLHASYDRPRLREEAPGVAGLRYRRSWSQLSRDFDLPPPFKAQRGAPLVEAVLVVPGAHGLEATVLVAGGLRAADLEWVAERAEMAAALLAGAGARLPVQVLDAAALARDGDAIARLAVFGALVGGRLSAAAWGALEVASRRPVEPATLTLLAMSAPAPLAALSLTLLCGAPAPSPLEVAGRLLGQGILAKRLADPEEFCARWAAEATAHRAALLSALALCRPRADRPAAVLDAGQVLSLGGELALAAARAVRRARRLGLDPALTAAWREAVGASLPRALQPALGARLSANGPLRTALGLAGDVHEVRLPSGTVLGRGGTPVQARVRALSLLASAALEPVLEHAEPPWRALAARLAQRRERPTLLLVVEPAFPSGPPFDPLNRGPGRALGFPGALEVWLRPGRRPSGRVVSGEQAVVRLVREVQAGHAVEVVASRSEAQPVAARLAQVAALLRDAPPRTQVALEAGGRVLLPRAGRLLRFPLDRFLARPRIFLPDPDAPDLTLSPGERRPVGLSAPGLIECRASLVDDQRASLLYADARGGQFREVVFLTELEEHLGDSRAVLQQSDPHSLLAVRLSDDVEPALRRVGRTGPAVPLAVRGQLPFDLQVDLGGLRYGGTSSGASWQEAARAVVARWPRTGEARLSVNAVTVQAGGRRAVGLMALYVRRIALRRLKFFVVRELQALSAGQHVPRT